MPMAGQNMCHFPQPAETNAVGSLSVGEPIETFSKIAGHAQGLRHDAARFAARRNCGDIIVSSIERDNLRKYLREAWGQVDVLGNEGCGERDGGEGCDLGAHGPVPWCSVSAV